MLGSRLAAGHAQTLVLRTPPAPPASPPHGVADCLSAASRVSLALVLLLARRPSPPPPRHRPPAPSAARAHRPAGARGRSGAGGQSLPGCQRRARWALCPFCTRRLLGCFSLVASCSQRARRTALDVCGRCCWVEYVGSLSLHPVSTRLPGARRAEGEAESLAPHLPAFLCLTSVTSSHSPPPLLPPSFLPSPRLAGSPRCCNQRVDLQLLQQQETAAWAARTQDGHS